MVVVDQVNVTTEQECVTMLPTSKQLHTPSLIRARGEPCDHSLLTGAASEDLVSGHELAMRCLEELTMRNLAAP